MEGKKISLFPVIILLTTLLVVSVFFYKLAFGWYPAKYTESAHVGVNRSTISSLGYAVGNCVHCHEQHASIEGSSHTPYDFSLFAPNNPDSQTANFCFQCHKGAGSVQVGGITNYTFSKNFGGGTATFTTIYDAFNPGIEPPASSHNLADVLNRAVSKAAWLYTANDNACIVCHNPHTAQRNYPVTVNAMGGVNTAVRKPGQHDDADYNLWGDEPKATSGWNEMMSDWTANYQAPYRVGKTTYEPAGDQTTNGSNLPCFVQTCRPGCHRTTVYSTERGANLEPINWTNLTSEPGTRSAHGKFANGLSKTGGWTIAPYTDDDTRNYVLSCTDCHEPHGSTNEWLLRTCVNGKDNISITEDGRWYEFCTACHYVKDFGSNHETYVDCSGCHGHNTPYF
ncbi:MAG: hypothetical protein JRJ42_01320 [Deltaproteobacteria bacterium]|nr:hypothetical protein [Deltaproteobacteria bacterium]MBW2018709.1 hypothetical protein [Deltaproteobacteria bacterium]MBW2073438.1 hypothetical protein [Deltaproteobacteria bacterium]